jgi:hypothetical protein
MTADPRSSTGASFLDRFEDLERRVAALEARGTPSIRRGTLTAYNRVAHTATVTVGGVSYAGIPVSYALGPWVMQIGAVVGVLNHSPDTPGNGCIVYVTTGGPPPNPMDPIMGHRHRGLEDDAPTL